MSSPHAYRPPLFRRLLPWLYLGVFCVMAPFVIFYTSGYRYNVKKGLVERNGTLIVDSIPKGANIVINNQDTEEETPITFQNQVPGWVHLSVSKPGYYPWEENLLIRPERVSFAHQIQLWREAQPDLILDQTPVQWESDPLEEKAAAIFSRATSTVLRFWSPETGFSSPIALPGSSTSSPRELSWREDGQVLLISETSTERKRTWWARARRQTPEANLLPNGSYHWSKSELVGNDGTSVLRLDPLRERVERSPLTASVVAASMDLELRKSTSSEQMILADEALLTRLYLLPRGQWEFAEIKRPIILLKEQDRWLGVALKFGQPAVETLVGDRPRWNPVSDLPTAAFLHEGEVWIWEFGQEPRLIWRQSEPLREAVWHRRGAALFLADRHEIKVIHLTDPSQSSQSLAKFEELRDFSLIQNELYLSGKRDDKDGVWRLRVE